MGTDWETVAGVDVPATRQKAHRWGGGQRLHNESEVPISRKQPENRKIAARLFFFLRSLKIEDRTATLVNGRGMTRMRQFGIVHVRRYHPY